MTIRLLGGLLLAATLYAQTSTGEFSGSVTDSSGAIIPHARVVATSVETGAAREVATDSNGSYVITFLQPGVYNVSAESQGFKKTVQNNVELRVNQRAEVSLQLQIGQVNDTVEVTAAAPLLFSWRVPAEIQIGAFISAIRSMADHFPK